MSRHLFCKVLVAYILCGMSNKINEIKSSARLNINLYFLSIVFTVFALIVSIKPDLLKESFIITVQLTFSIPLLISSIFARSKLAHTDRPKLWEDYGYFLFILAHAFLINTLGILIALLVDKDIAVAFLTFNILSAAVYSMFEIIEKPSKLRPRIIKDLYFAALIIIGGVLPSLGVY